MFHRLLEISTWSMTGTLLVIWAGGCGIGSMLSGGQAWRAQTGGEVTSRSRRWPASVPPVEGAFDVELYKLRLGGEVLSFRNTHSVEKSFVSLLGALREEGWQVLEQHGTGWERAISGCGSDCGTRRFFATVEAARSGQVVTTVRVSVPGEFGRNLRLAGNCRRLDLALEEADSAAARYGPVFSADLDRDGRLDGFIPRLDQESPEGEPVVVWDAVVTRDDCAHVVGTFPGVPADSAFSPMGQRGLVDLVVSSRVTIDGNRQRITERYRYDGAHYVAVERY